MRFGPETLTLEKGAALVVRHCASSDAASFGPFHQHIVRESSFTLQRARAAPVEWIADEWRRCELSPRELRLGAFADENRLMAMLSIQPTSPRHPATAHICTIGILVIAEVWGQGLGSTLLARARAVAGQVGYSRLEASVRARNSRAIRLFESAGYVREGLRRRAALVDGQLEDEILFAQLISE